MILAAYAKERARVTTPWVRCESVRVCVYVCAGRERECHQRCALYESS